MLTGVDMTGLCGFAISGEVVVARVMMPVELCPRPHEILVMWMTMEYM